MKSLVEYIEEQMLLEYAGVFNGADKIAEDIYQLIQCNVTNISVRPQLLTYAVTDFINDKFKEIQINVSKYPSRYNNDIGGECLLPNFSNKSVCLIFKFVYNNSIEECLLNKKYLLKQKIKHELTHAIQQYENYSKFIDDSNKQIHEMIPTKSSAKSFALDLSSNLYRYNKKDKAGLTMYVLSDFEKNAFLSELEDAIRITMQKSEFKNIDFRKSVDTTKFFNELFKIEPLYRIKELKEIINAGYDEESLIKLRKLIYTLTIDDINNLDTNYIDAHYEEISAKQALNFVNKEMNKFEQKLQSNFRKLVCKIIQDDQS